MMSEDINGFLCHLQHFKLATVHGKMAKVKRQQHETAILCLTMLRSTHLTWCTLSREESLPNIQNVQNGDPILFPCSPPCFAGQCLYLNQNCRKTTDTKTSTNRRKNNFNVPQESWPSVVDQRMINEQSEMPAKNKIPYPMRHYAFGRVL